jgi:uncharacterized protein HemY
MTEEFLKRNPGSPDAYQAMGMGYYRAGEWTQAIDALAKGNQESETWFFMAMACWQSGDRNQARQCYDKAVRHMETNAPGDVNNRILQAEAAALLGLPDAPVHQITTTTSSASP